MSMKQKIGSRSFFNYTEEAMENAIDAVRNGMSKKKAAISFNVPRTTLIRKLRCPVPDNHSVELLNVLKEVEEAALKKWIIGLESMEDGDGNIKADKVKDAKSSTTNEDNDVDNPLKVCAILSLKKNTIDGEVNISKEGEGGSSNLNDLSNIEVLNKVNGELECPKKSDLEVSKGNSVNDANENEIDQSLDSQEINNKQTDEVKISRKRKNQINTDSLVESEKKSEVISEGSISESHTVEFKGFKKRILAQAEKLKDINNINSSENIERIKKTKTKSVSTKKNKLNSEKDHAQQEYAQYLGLQPTVKFKCYRCSEKFQTMALLQGHQRICGSLPPKTNHQQAALSPVDPNLSTNFRITRKVYLCSACGTYYENWNLFLHMREVHKRHICLFCLGMFSVADKLAEHLMSKHSIHESIIGSNEEFLSVFKGSCFLMCCTCEKIFTERDDFYGHHCTDPAIAALNMKCPLCGVKCGHFLTCPNNTPHCTTTTTMASNLKLQMSPTGNKSTPQGMTVTKYLVPISKTVADKWTKSKSVLKSQKEAPPSSMDYDEDYDISDAASFCHVDIGDEAAMSIDKSEIDKSNSADNCSEKQVIDNNEKQLLKLQEGEQNSEQSKEVETPLVVPLEPLKIITNDVDKPDVKLRESGNELKEGTKIIEDKVDGRNEIGSPHMENLTSPNIIKVDTFETPSDEEITNVIAPEICKDSENLALNKNGTSSKPNEEVLGTLVSGEDNDSILPNSSIENVKIDDDDDDDDKDVVDDNTIEKRIDDRDNDTTDSQTQNTDNIESPEKDTKDISSEESTSHHIDDQKTNQSLDDVSDGGFSDANFSDVEMEPENKSSKHDSDLSQESSDEEQSIHQSDNNKPNENGEKSDSDSEDSDKLSLVVDDKVKNCSEDESVSEKCNKNTDVENKDDDFDSNLSNSGNQDEFLNEKSLDNTNCHKNYKGDDNSNDNSSVESKQYGTIESRKDEKIPDDGVQVASDDVPAMALTLEDKLDTISGQSVIKECVRTSCTTCVYCSHAVKIAVNGKQLALHLLAEHRYTPIKNETTEDVVIKLKKSLPNLENVFFNTDSYDSSDKSLNVPHDQTYECFQCHFMTKSHKELYIHKKKMHQKTILLCVMCKSNFYSYSELLCHMCPGIYVSEDITFRCCYCNLDRIPSAFRLMVHLRKSHHTCDICLEVPGDQQKLSTHMWKHKLHHLCYKCGIAYRNKPDITKHLFWKHGTESVLCKKCLQKKWPHVYHFCIPPTVFICEECNASFSRAVALKVHKRLHGGDSPYVCNQCEQKFISKKLLTKHEENHKPVIPQNNLVENTKPEDGTGDDKEETINVVSLDDTASQQVTKDSNVNNTLIEGKNKTETQDSKSHKKRKKDKDKKNKHVVDVYDLPPLNLSSESDDSEDDNKTLPRKSQCDEDVSSTSDQVQSDNLNTVKELQDSESIHESEDTVQPVPVVDGVWDNFHSYKAQLEKREALDSSTVSNILTNTPMDISQDNNLLNAETETSSNIHSKTNVNNARNIVMADHDYCLQSIEKIGEQKDVSELEVQIEKPAPREHSSSIDHDYCSSNNIEPVGLTTPVNDIIPVQQPPPQPPPVETPSPKKKVKASKKKFNKHNSSSSSDSSSDSDSSSCSCGTNCSCSSSSSNSSSSSSSDSESSSSEGRQRAAARKERRKEKTKTKQEDDITIAQPSVIDTQPVEDEPIVDLPVEPIETPIQESDLDTDETLTDEDFYDQHPQRHANQLLAEKRNQLMLLAAVAPVNNGTVSSPPIPPQPPTPPPVSPPVLKPSSPRSASPLPQPSPVKRKVKSKKRKKSQQQTIKRSDKIISSFYDTQPSTSFPAKKPSVSQTITNNTSISSPHHPPVPNLLSDTTPGSGSETDSTRLSKRKRVRNKFYGYSSDEEEDSKPPGKWRKVEPLSVPQQPTPVYNYQRSLPVQRPVPPIEVHYDQKQSDSSGSEDEEEVPVKKEAAITSNSSSSSSESDNEVKPAAVATTEQTEKSDNLYCYCQCPYDEVSEMIACDGLDCTIEWFHFECVGIMVPPKGKWYCPDCRKRRDSM